MTYLLLGQCLNPVPPHSWADWDADGSKTTADKALVQKMEKASSVSARWGTVRALKRIVSLSKTESAAPLTLNSAPEPDLKLSTRVKGGDRRTQQQQKLREAQAAAKSTKKRVSMAGGRLQRSR